MTDNIIPFWIPCAVRFPESDARILAVLDEGESIKTEVIIATYTKFYGSTEDKDVMGWYDENGSWYPEECVTHWIPLPTPPSK